MELFRHKQKFRFWNINRNSITKLPIEEEITVIMFSTITFFFQNHGKCHASGLSTNGCLPSECHFNNNCNVEILVSSMVYFMELVTNQQLDTVTFKKSLL